MTQSLPTNETLLMSHELEEQLGYLRDDEADAVSPECMAYVLDLNTSFRILGWDSNAETQETHSYAVTIELNQPQLHHFFDSGPILRVKIFDCCYAIARTDAKVESGDWTAKLYLDRLNQLEGDI